MAKRRDKTRGKINESMKPAVAELLHPGEHVRAAALVLSGPRPWLLGVIGMMLLNRFYYLVVTESRALFIRTTGLTRISPKGLEFSDPLSPGAVVDYRPSPLWTVIKYRRPDGSILRLNMNRLWLEDREPLVAALKAAPAGATEASPTVSGAPPAPPPQG